MNLWYLAVGLELSTIDSTNTETSQSFGDIKGPQKDMKQFFHETATKLYIHIDF